MTISIDETFEVDAPIDAVWKFLTDPHRVVECVPGAELIEVLEDHTFRGRVKVKVGAVTALYEGKASFLEIDESAYKVRIAAEGRETGGGVGNGTMSSHLRAIDDGRTEVVTQATVEITGRMMQFGRGMIKGVSEQLFQQFVASTKERLEAPEGAERPVVAGEKEPIALLPIVLRTVWQAIVGFFRRLLRRPA